MARRFALVCAVALFALASSQPLPSGPFPFAVRGDFTCVFATNRELMLPDYPSTMSVLLDSYHFKDLILPRNSDLWHPIGAWQDGFGGLCRRITWGCSALFAGSAEGNHFFTPYIPLWGVNKVFIEVSYAAVCITSPCRPQEAKLSVYESSLENNDLGHKDGSHFSFTGTVSTSRQDEVTDIFTVTPDANTSGIYLKFSEENSCITINRVLVYGESCSDKIESLLYYPLTFSPDDLTPYTRAVGLCLENSSFAISQGMRTVTPTVHCAAEGVWLPHSGCECDPGLYFDGIGCTTCPPGTHKHDYGNALSCYECPENSDSDESASSECSCIDGFYRVRGEPVTEKCTTVPSPPTDLEIDAVTNTSVHIAWKPPADLGGRSDIYYKIFYQETDMMHFGMFEATRTTGFKAWVTGLKPVTYYTIRVIACNNVSYIHGDDTMSRTDVFEKTKEGVPEKVIVYCRRKKTFSWQPPKVTNGDIIGFDVRQVCQTGMAHDVVEFLEADSVEFCYSPLTLPETCDMIYVQVRAETKIGAGEWSDPVKLCIPDTDPTTPTPPTTPTSPTTKPTTEPTTESTTEPTARPTTEATSASTFGTITSSVPTSRPSTDATSASTFGTITSSVPTSRPSTEATSASTFGTITSSMPTSRPSTEATSASTFGTITSSVPTSRPNTEATSASTFGTITSSMPTSRPTTEATSSTPPSSSCPDGIPPCNYDTCQQLGHQLCVVDETGCGGSCQVSSCRVCTAGVEFSADECAGSQCVGDYQRNNCIQMWGACVKRQRVNRNIFVRPTSDNQENMKCVPHPCLQ